MLNGFVLTFLTAGSIFVKVKLLSYGGARSPLPTHHLIDPDWRERGSAAFGDWVVAVDSEFIANCQGAVAKIRIIDSDPRETEIHCPLSFWRGTRHLFLNAVKNRREVESFWTFANSLGCQAPAGTGDPRVLVSQ